MQRPLKNRLQVFRGLRRFTRAEAATLNAAAMVLKDPYRWQPWVEEAFGELFQIPRGYRVTLTKKNTLNQDPPESCAFAQDTISIGRAPDNDLVLPLNSVSRKHARVVFRDGDFYVEDLQSAGGTHVGGLKLEPKQQRRLQGDDQFLIFPYAFQASSEEIWERDGELAVMFSRGTPTMARAFQSLLGADLCVFDLQVHPNAGSACLALTRPFLEVALSRLSRGTVTELTGDDTDLLHFLVLNVLRRANGGLQFPFQCSLAPRGRNANGNLPDIHDEAGMMLEVALKLTGTQGRMLLFLPESVASLAQEAAPQPRLSALRAVLRYKLTLRLGFVLLTVFDLQNTRPGDALLYTPRPEVLLPARGVSPGVERGWSVAQDDENDHRFVVDTYFERIAGMEEREDDDGEEIAGAVESLDVQTLPVRVHVVIGEIELPLANLETLKAGSVVELEASPDRVQLVVNGKLLGTGELVEIEDRLAVQITRWEQA